MVYLKRSGAELTPGARCRVKLLDRLDAAAAEELGFAVEGDHGRFMPRCGIAVGG